MVRKVLREPSTTIPSLNEPDVRKGSSSYTLCTFVGINVIVVLTVVEVDNKLSSTMLYPSNISLHADFMNRYADDILKGYSPPLLSTSHRLSQLREHTSANLRGIEAYRCVQVVPSLSLAKTPYVISAKIRCELGLKSLGQ